MSSRVVTQMLRYPAAERNKELILQVFRTVLTNEGIEGIEGRDGKPLNALEIGSGSGQHICHLAQHLPHIQWQPTDVDKRLFPSIEAYARHSDLKNVLPPIPLDVSAPVDLWPMPGSAAQLDLIVCINVIHITAWNCTSGLFKGSSTLLKDRTGLLLLYGPYACDGVLSPESNVSFDRSLRTQNPEWGVRDIRDLKALADTNGLTFVSTHEMPANNKILVFRKI